MKKLAETFDDFFLSLLFGEGAWIGALLIIVLLVLITIAWKYSVVVTIAFSMILAVSYMNRAMPWQALVMLSYSIFGLYHGYKELT